MQPALEQSANDLTALSLMTNPLLVSSGLRHEALAFADIKTEHFLPAVCEQIRRAYQRVQAIKTNPQPANFTNTIVALEDATAGVNDIAYIYSNLKSANGEPALHTLAKEIMPRLMELESDINLDAEIFARVQAVHQQCEASAALNEEERMLVEKTFRSFKRNGGLLTAADKAKLRRIDEELSTLGPAFSENVLKATNSYALVLTDPAELQGLPTSAIEAAAQTAREKGYAAATWIFTLHAPSLNAFLRYADHRERRRELWLASASRALNGAHSNQALVCRLATLRFERAQLLGYASHAHFQLEERMAEHPDKVRVFLDSLLQQTLPAARAEMAELAAYKAKASGDATLEPWDYPYWANKLKEERYLLNDEELRPYFRLESVLAGAFEHARRLYGLSFEAVNDLPVYQKDVQVYEVREMKSDGTNAFVGLFYVDFFPSDRKGGGAWATRFKTQWRQPNPAGSGPMLDHRPHVSIVCNFTKPTAAKPSLLTFSEVNTLFHEFGHALHSLLSRCTYRSLSCTNVYRDFVELPSQIMENWIAEPDSLELFARHYLTGERIPKALIERIRSSDNFHVGYLTVRQLRFALLDLAWHAGDPRAVKDVQAYESEQLQATQLLPDVAGTNISCSFEHIFSGGYSAGYYGYKWAEVLDADAFELFLEEGIFSRKIADRFRAQILEKGGTEHPMTLYRRFRGRDPDPQALLRRSKLI